MSDFANLLKKKPSFGKDVWLAEGCRVIGAVSLGNQSSVWYNAVLRGDSDFISVGDRSNIQDNAVLHADPGFPTILGNDVIVGHLALVHGAKVSNNVLIGMNSTVMNGADIGEYSIIGANALVTNNMIIPPYSLVLGVPAKIVRQINEEEKNKIEKNADAYVKLAAQYLSLQK